MRVTLFYREIDDFRNHFELLFTSCDESVHFGATYSQKIDKSGKKQYKNHKENYNDWGMKERVEEWRTAWADCCNARLPEENRIDHRSYKRQGIDKIPTIHEGYTAREIVSKGRTFKRIKINNEIRESNNLLREIADEQKQIESELKELKKKLDGDDKTC